MSFKSILASIGKFFSKLFNRANDVFNELPKEQRDAIVQSVLVSDIIKTAGNYSRAVADIAATARISAQEADALLISLSENLGYAARDPERAFNFLLSVAKNALTDNAWNEIWQRLAKFAAVFLSKGECDWITLGLGVIEFAYQKFIKKI